jgi:uncharacterized protein (DUF302 family)
MTQENASQRGQTTYGYFRKLDKPFADAIIATKEALKGQGFGVLAEIDIQKAMQEKLGVSYPPYMILGACNPKLAHQALGSEPELGLLLPCNVIVREADGSVEVGVIDAEKMLGFVENPALAPVGQQAAEKLRAALAAIQ